MKKGKKTKRRDFLRNLSLASAALTLNGAFGMPVETENRQGRLFLKLDNYTFPADQLEKLRNGKMESLAIKFDISIDKRNWQTLNTSITDQKFMKQLTEIAQKTNRWRRF